jgi:hypothetical protein
MASRAVSWILGLIGAVGGGVVGFYGFAWFARHGFYAMILPGGLLGAGCGALAGTKSQLRGILCAAAALALSVYSEWAIFPFVADDSFGYFLRHVQDLSPVKLLMMALGTFAAYYFGRDSLRGAGWDRKPPRGAGGVPD